MAGGTRWLSHISILERHTLAEIVRNGIAVAQRDAASMNSRLVGSGDANLDLVGKHDAAHDAEGDIFGEDRDALRRAVRTNSVS
jgi:hypothetical protein